MNVRKRGIGATPGARLQKWNISDLKTLKTIYHHHHRPQQAHKNSAHQQSLGPEFQELNMDMTRHGPLLHQIRLSWEGNLAQNHQGFRNCLHHHHLWL